MISVVFKTNYYGILKIAEADMYMDYLKQTYNAAQEKHRSIHAERKQLHILYLKFVYYKGVIVFNFEIGYFVDSELW